jgi:outer membrane protein OmpA-like peptidoglycan-associated protein
MRNRFTLTPALLLLVSGLAAASDGSDAPLISRYPGAEVRKTYTIDYEPFQIPSSTVTGSSKPYKYTAIETKGKLARHFYLVKDVSSLKVYENYVAAIKKLGFTTTFSCQLDACGTDEQTQALGTLISVEDNVYNYYRKPYYLVAEKTAPKGKIYGAWFIGSYENEVAVQQAIVESEPLEDGLIKVDPAYLNKAAAVTAPEKSSASDLAKDNKLLARYPNATLRKSLQADSETFSIPAAPNAADKTPLRLSGDLSRHFYVINGVSTLKVFENYQQALMKAGFTFLSKCELAACGSENGMEKLGAQISVEDSVYNYYRKPYYLVAKKPAPAGDMYVALFVGGFESEVAVQQVILKSKALETGLIKVDADTLKSQIDADGRALIYGIYFDTGQAVVKPASKPTLDVIAQLLTKNVNLLLYVVGHTDDTGVGDANLDLSRQRASAVVNKLVNEYKIPAARLQARGVGPYAPAGNNTTDAGKQKNRRVELVKRLQ